MPVRVQDLIDDEAVAYINCQECGRLVRLAGPRLLARLGPTRPIRAVVAALTCQKCGFPGDLVVKFEREELAAARARRGLAHNVDWPSSARDLADIDAGARGETEAVCNLYSNTMPPAAMRDLFEVAPEHDHLGNAEPRASIFPKGLAPVVRVGQGGHRELVEMRWGFLTPNFSKRTGAPIKPTAWNNARDDKLPKNGLWRSSLVERRCLIPVTAFNETRGQKPAEDYWFGLVADDPDDRPPFAVAGLWRLEQEELRGQGEHGLTHTMVTTAANDLIRPIHKPKRMPVVLDPENYETWLLGSVDEALALLRPYPSDRMRIVRRGVGEKSDPAPPAVGHL